jgi:hypothetical protein
MNTVDIDPAPIEPAPVEPAPVEPAPVEPSPVEPDNIQIEFSENLLSLLLNTNLTCISLTDNEINILKQLISISPGSITTIHDCSLEIIKDGKIDARDIPPLLKIVKDIYILCHQEITVKVTNFIRSIGTILKYILQIVLIKNNLSTPELLESINSLIDIVVEMIQLQSSFKTKTCFFKLC